MNMRDVCDGVTVLSLQLYAKIVLSHTTRH